MDVLLELTINGGSLVRKPFALLLLLVAGGSLAQEVPAPATLLQRGLDSYRAGDAASAVTDLDAAAQGFGLSPETLSSLETSLVYLALAHFRLGREEAARETLLRIHAVEQVQPVYASLPLGADAAEIEALAAALLPAQPLPPNGDRQADESVPLPAIIPRRDPARATGPAPVASNAEAFSLLRAADAAAENGAIGDAVERYSLLATDPAVVREVLILAAIGLYRTGAFPDAALAFRRLETFARGEDDLRFYYAVSLYESGDFAEAKKQILCALPFILETDEVLRATRPLRPLVQVNANPPAAVPTECTEGLAHSEPGPRIDVKEIPLPEGTLETTVPLPAVPPPPRPEAEASARARPRRAPTPGVSPKRIAQISVRRPEGCGNCAGLRNESCGSDARRGSGCRGN